MKDQMQMHTNYFREYAPIIELDDMEFENRWQEKVYRLGENYTKYKSLKNVSEHKSFDGILVQQIRIFI